MNSKIIFLSVSLLVGSFTYSQVGVNKVDPKSTLDINGSFASTITEITDPLAMVLDETHQTLVFRGSGGSIVLPVASTCQGREYTLVNFATNNVTFNTTIDVGSVTENFIPVKSSYRIKSNGTAWIKVNNTDTLNIYNSDGTITPGEARSVTIPDGGYLVFDGTSSPDGQSGSGNILTYTHDGDIGFSSSGAGQIYIYSSEKGIDISADTGNIDLSTTTPGGTMVPGNIIMQKDVSYGNVGIGTSIPTNKLTINSFIPNESGLTFTNLTSISPVTVGATAIGVDNTGKVVTVGSSGAIRTTVNSTTLLLTDETILVNAVSGNKIITLPTTIIGKKYFIKKVDVSANQVIVTPTSGLIDGLLSLSGNTAWQGWLIQFDGTNWYIISRF